MPQPGPSPWKARVAGVWKFGDRLYTPRERPAVDRSGALRTITVQWFISNVPPRLGVPLAGLLLLSQLCARRRPGLGQDLLQRPFRRGPFLRGTAAHRNR